MWLVIRMMQHDWIIKIRVKGCNQESTDSDILGLLSTDYLLLMGYWQNTHHPSDTTS